MTFIVATNVVASRPPERWPTGTPHACAKNRLFYCSVEVVIVVSILVVLLIFVALDIEFRCGQ